MQNIDEKDSSKQQNGTMSANASSPQLRLATNNLKSSYANFCTLNMTREEIVLSFGLNHTWEQPSSEITIDLAHRVVLSPFSAFRLMQTLQSAMQDYEQRYGKLLPDPK